MSSNENQQNKPAKPAFKPVGLIRVEMGDSHNRNFVWPPDQRHLRGRWARANLAGVTTADSFTGMPDLPGLVIEIDFANKSMRIFDPLALPANKPILDEAIRVCEATFPGTRPAPESEVIIREMTDDEIKSATWYVRRFLDAKHCREIRGSVPSAEDIQAMAGRVRYEGYDSRPGVDNYRSPVRYIPVASEPGILREATLDADA